MKVMFQYRLTLGLRLTTAIHLKHSQILTKYCYIIKSQYALTVRCYCMLNLSLSRDCLCKTLVNQRLFPFSERFMLFSTYGHVSESQ